MKTFLELTIGLVQFSTTRTIIYELLQAIGILGIRDLTKIRCGIPENAKDLDGIRDFAATQEMRFAKICTRDAGSFACLSGIRKNRHDPNKRSRGKSESTRPVKNINRKGQTTSYIY